MYIVESLIFEIEPPFMLNMFLLANRIQSRNGLLAEHKCRLYCGCLLSGCFDIDMLPSPSMHPLKKCGKYLLGINNFDNIFDLFVVRPIFNKKSKKFLSPNYST